MSKRPQALLLAHKPLNNMRRVGLLASYLAKHEFNVHVYCLASDPRHANNVSIKFYEKSDIGWMERCVDKALRIRSNFFETKFSGMKRILATIANLTVWPFLFFLNLLCILFSNVTPNGSRFIMLICSKRYRELRRVIRVKTFNRNCRAALELPRETMFDLILCHDIYPSQTALAVKSSDGCPLWMDIVDNISQRSYMGNDEVQPVGLFVKAALQSTDLFILNSDYQPLPKSEHPALTEYVLNANPHHINIQNKVHGESDLPSFIISGTHFEASGVEKAIVFTHDYSEDATLTIIGPFPQKTYKTAVMDEINRLEMGHRVTIEAMLPPDEIIRRISSMSAVLICFDPAHNNLKTILPNRMFDALSAQTPVIAQTGTAVAQWVEDTHLGIAANFDNTSEAVIRSKAFVESKDTLKAIKPLQDIWTWENQVKRLTPHLVRLNFRLGYAGRANFSE